MTASWWAEITAAGLCAAIWLLLVVGMGKLSHSQSWKSAHKPAVPANVLDGGCKQAMTTLA